MNDSPELEEVTTPQAENPQIPNEQDNHSQHHNDDDVNKPKATDGNPEKKEDTRSRMAILFVLGFFAILFLCIVYSDGKGCIAS